MVGWILGIEIFYGIKFSGNDDFFFGEGFGSICGLRSRRVILVENGCDEKIIFKSLGFLIGLLQNTPHEKEGLTVGDSLGTFGELGRLGRFHQRLQTGLGTDEILLGKRKAGEEKLR